MDFRNRSAINQLISIDFTSPAMRRIGLGDVIVLTRRRRVTSTRRRVTSIDSNYFAKLNCKIQRHKLKFDSIFDKKTTLYCIKVCSRLSIFCSVFHRNGRLQSDIPCLFKINWLILRLIHSCKYIVRFAWGGWWDPVPNPQGENNPTLGWVPKY